MSLQAFSCFSNLEGKNFLPHFLHGTKSIAPPSSAASNALKGLSYVQALL